jgi:hypothetical protein
MVPYHSKAKGRSRHWGLVLPINNPITRTTIPELVAGRLQAVIWPQLIDSKRLACKRIGLASFKMLVNRRAFVGMSVPGHHRVMHRLERDLDNAISTYKDTVGCGLAAYHVDKMIRDFSRLVISWIRKSEDRSELSTLALEVGQDLLVPLVGFDLPHLSRQQPSRDLIQVTLLVPLKRVFKLRTQATLSTFSIAVSDGELLFLALENECRESLEILGRSLRRGSRLADLFVRSQSR